MPGIAHAGACSWQELRLLVSTHRIKFSSKNYSLWRIHPRAVLEELQPVERTHMGEICEGHQIDLTVGAPLQSGEKSEKEEAADTKCYEVTPTHICHPSCNTKKQEKVDNLSVQLRKGGRRGMRKLVFFFVFFLPMMATDFDSRVFPPYFLPFSCWGERGLSTKVKG